MYGIILVEFGEMDLEKRLRRPRAGARDRRLTFEAFDADLAARIAVRRLKISRLEAEITKLELRRAEGRQAHLEVEEEKGQRRDRLGRVESAGVIMERLQLSEVDHNGVVRFSELPVERAPGGAAWSTPLASAEGNEVGPPITDFINADVELLLRRADMLHGMYLWDKRGFVAADKLTEFRKVRRFDDWGLTANECETVFDADVRKLRKES